MIIDEINIRDLYMDLLECAHTRKQIELQKFKNSQPSPDDDHEDLISDEVIEEPCPISYMRLDFVLFTHSQLKYIFNQNDSRFIFTSPIQMNNALFPDSVLMPVKLPTIYQWCKQNPNTIYGLIHVSVRDENHQSVILAEPEYDGLSYLTVVTPKLYNRISKILTRNVDSYIVKNTESEFIEELGTVTIIRELLAVYPDIACFNINEITSPREYLHRTNYTQFLKQLLKYKKITNESVLDFHREERLSGVLMKSVIVTNV